MYPTLMDRKPLHRVLDTLSESLDLRHETITTGGGYADHILYGIEADVRDLGKVLKRAGFAHVRSRLSIDDGRYALTIKHVWHPTHISVEGSKP